jgi:hypothetical protein
MLLSHGLVGIMVFYEVVVAKVMVFVLALGALQAAGFSFLSPPDRVLLVFGAAAAGILAIGFLLCAALALAFKLTAYHLAAAAASVPSPDG